MIATMRIAGIAIGALLVVTPASAQWTRVPDVPATQVFAVWANGDTIVAGADTSVTVSTDAGATWKRSRMPTVGVAAIDAVRLRNGRLYAGTFGQGVFISDDLGGTWQAFNQGLVGGPLDSQLDVSDFAIRGDSLFAATEGAGVYERNLATTDTWHHFGEEFEPNEASNVNALALGGVRLLAAAGANGTVFRRDPGDAGWTVSELGNTGLLPGVQPESAIWDGGVWVVGTSVGVFHSVTGDAAWTFFDPGIGGLLQTWFASRGRRLFAAFDIVTAAVIEQSADDGASWQVLESLPHVFVFELAMSGSTLYAGRGDGLWRRSTADVSVPARAAPNALRFGLAGPQPIGDRARFHFELPEPATVTIELFDVAGRLATPRREAAWPAGAHEMSWDTHDLGPGVYEARLTAGKRHAVARFVRVR